MQWLIAGLINLVLEFVEASFRRPQYTPNNSGEEEDSPKSRSKKLQEAYDFMELTPPASEEQLKKQYKKLSLRYHPDRNGGSQDSKAKFQKLQDCRDCIDRELAGLLDEEEEEPQQDEGPPETGDPLYDFIQKQQAAQRKYREMQEAAEKARQEEFERQEERKQEFHAQADQERKRCQQKRQQKGLETKPGRVAAYEQFQQKAQEKVGPLKKPTYDIMECNTNDMVMALRWNMPQVVFELMNQQLPTFAQTKGNQLARQGIKVTAKRLKMEFMRQGLDEDDNNLLHYAIYYECYEIITMICTAALNDGYLDQILHQSNVHGNTPLFFAQLAQDTSILSLVQNQLLLNDQEKANTQVLFALQAGVHRLGELLKHQFGIIATLDTLLSFWMAYTLFEMNATACIGALFWTHVLHTDSVYLEEIPGVHSFAAHTAFCIVWVATRWGLGRFRYWEVALLVMPVLVLALFARICAVSLDLDTTVLDRILFLPVWLPAQAGNQLERILILSQRYAIPKVVLQKGLARSYLLIVTAVLAWIAMSLSR